MRDVSDYHLQALSFFEPPTDFWGERHRSVYWTPVTEIIDIACIVCKAGLWNCGASVCLSHHAATERCCDGFAAVGLTGRRYRHRSIAVWPFQQFHVDSWCRKLNTNLFSVWRYTISYLCDIQRIMLKEMQMAVTLMILLLIRILPAVTVILTGIL